MLPLVSTWVNHMRLRVTALPGPQSPRMGMDVNKVGIRTGWTTGETSGYCANAAVPVHHSDRNERRTQLDCYIRADTPANSGDTGSALFASISDGPGSENDGIFLGILSACFGCDKYDDTQTGNGIYVSRAAIDAAMNQYITLHEDQGGS